MRRSIWPVKNENERVVSTVPELRANMAAVEERAELHKTIWRIANDLRGSADGWDFKS